MNVVTSETLKDTMAHPEHYRNLIVRIANYSAYFVTRNRDMQLKFIERAECHGCHRLIANGVQGDLADAAADRHCGSVILDLAKKL